jgi:hypothetical protein
MRRRYGIVGIPIVEVGARFFMPCRGRHSGSAGPARDHREPFGSHRRDDSILMSNVVSMGGSYRWI